MSRLIVVLMCVLVPSLALAQKEPAAPKPETYLCPDSVGTRAIDCFLNAVEHLYTMCRQVKSIEIIEFGYEKSDEGVNGAKSTYCVDKHKQSIARPYQAAVREAGGHRTLVERLRSLHDAWLKSLHELKWHPGESDEQYKARISQPYDSFREQATAVRTELTNPGKANAAAPGKGSPAAIPAKANKSKTADGGTAKGTN
jgi:hypothetical protein